MALDPSIILGYRPTQVESPLNALGQALKIKGYQQETDMGALKMQDMERERSADNALAQLISAGGKPEDIATGLATKGYGKQSLAYTKQQQELAKQRADIDKTGAETGKLKTEALNAKVKLSRDALATINDPQSAASWVAAMYQDPEFAPLTAKSGRTLEQAVAAIPRDPEGFKAWKMQSSLGAEKLVEYTTPTANTVATNATTQRGQDMTDARTRSEGAANRGVTIRGQDLSDTRARDLNEIQRNGKVSETSTGLRKEFEGLPEVKNYKQALPSYKGIEDAVTRNTPMSDINIVYGIAKLYDPNSVVREGEYATVAKSPAIPERIKGYAQYLAGGGKLTDEVKAQILTEAKSRMKSYEDQYTAARTGYEDIAKRSNADPTLLFPSAQTPAISTASAPGKNAAGSLSADEAKELATLRARYKK